MKQIIKKKKISFLIVVTFAIIISLLASIITLKRVKNIRNKQIQMQKQCTYNINNQNTVFNFLGSLNLDSDDYQMYLTSSQMQHNRSFQKAYQPATKMALQAQYIKTNQLPIATSGNRGYEYDQNGQRLTKRAFSKNTNFTLKDKLKSAPIKDHQYHQYLDCISKSYDQKLYVPMKYINYHYFYRLQDGNLLLANDVKLIDQQRLVGVNVPCTYNAPYMNFWQNYFQIDEYEHQHSKPIIHTPIASPSNDDDADDDDESPDDEVVLWFFENNYNYFHTQLNGWKSYAFQLNLRHFKAICNNSLCHINANAPLSLVSVTSFDTATNADACKLSDEEKSINAPVYSNMQDTLHSYEYAHHRFSAKAMNNIFYLKLKTRQNGKNYYCYFPYDPQASPNSKYLKLDGSMNHKLVASAPDQPIFSWSKMVKQTLALRKKHNYLYYLRLKKKYDQLNLSD